MESSFDQVAKTVAFDETVAATYTVFTPDSGRRFVVSRWYLQSLGAGTIKFVSNATDISGVFTLAAAFYSDDGTGRPVLFGIATGDALKVVLTGGVRVSGYFVVAQL
jgi:hypothetical protein